MAEQKSEQFLQEKLESLLIEQAKNSDPLQKFSLKKAIEETEEQLTHCTNSRLHAIADLDYFSKSVNNQFNSHIWNKRIKWFFFCWLSIIAVLSKPFLLNIEHLKELVIHPYAHGNMLLISIAICASVIVEIYSSNTRNIANTFYLITIFILFIISVILFCYIPMDYFCNNEKNNSNLTNTIDLFLILNFVFSITCIMLSEL